MSKKKKYLILLTVTLLLAAITAGIYLFVNPSEKVFTSYKVDKYSDTTNWCDTSIKDGKLTVDCKALLINIDASSCFEVQVITKDKELKDLTVCENGDTLTYTNEVLGYKKLMPVDMVFTYAKAEILSSYSFNNVSFGEVDDTYIQSIINEDIAELVTIDPSTTTIQNSVDFCPRPETLPSYVIEENKAAYMGYYNKNKMVLLDYDNGIFYDLKDPKVRILLGCISKNIVLGNTIDCVNLETSLNTETLNNINGKAIPNVDGTLSETERFSLKELSILYDSKEFVTFSNKEELIGSFVSNSYSSEAMFCAKALFIQDKIMNSSAKDDYISFIQDALTTNLKNLTSGMCKMIVEEIPSVNSNGLYILIYHNNKAVNEMAIMNRCYNLFSFL